MLAPQKRGVGFVFQHYAAFKHMTVWDNVAFGLVIRKRPKAEIRARVDQLLELVQLVSLGEYGAVAVVSGRLQGQTETATLRVQERYESFDLPGAYAISLVLALIAVIVLITMTAVRPREEAA